MVNDIKQMSEIRIRVKYKQVLIQIILCLSVVGRGMSCGSMRHKIKIKMSRLS